MIRKKIKLKQDIGPVISDVIGKALEDHQTLADTGRPYSETQKDGYVVREFSNNTPAFEFVWHRDKEDRIVEPMHDTDWKFQLDNLPPSQFSRIFIPKGVYHRLIKGTGKLKVKMYKIIE